MGFVSVVGQDIVRSAPEKNATARNTSARVQASAMAMPAPKLKPVAKTRLLSTHRSPSICVRIASVNATSPLVQDPEPFAASGAAKMVFLASVVANVKYFVLRTSVAEPPDQA